MMRKNVYIALIGQWALAVLSFASSLVIARLLRPAELGVFTVSLSIITVLQTIQQTGAREFLLYSKDVDAETRRSAFALAILSSGALSAVLLISAPYVAIAYKTDGMRFVLNVVAFNTMATVFTMPIAAMLAREQNFSLISTISVVTNLVQVIVQVVLAWLGYSYRALAMALTASTLTGVALHFILRPQHITLRPQFRGMRRLMGFGSRLFVINVLNQISNAAPNVIIGYTNSLAIAANYGRANNINQIYATTVGRAVDPVIAARMAAETRAGRSSIESMLGSSRALLAISGTFFGIVSLYAHLIVPLMFGPQWGDAIAPTRLLAIGFAVWPLNSPINAMLMSEGKTGILLRLRLINTVMRVAVVVMLARYGLTVIAAGILAAIYINTVQSAAALRKVSGLSLREFGAGLSSSLFVVLCAVGASYLGPLALPPGTRPIIVVGVAGIAAFVGWALALRVTNHVLWVEFKVTLAAILRYTRALFNRARAPRAG